MTFEQLFTKTLESVDTTKTYKGRNNAIDAFISSLEVYLAEIVKNTPWTRSWASIMYGDHDPVMEVSAHGVLMKIPFKVKLKKNGTVPISKYSYYGTTTCYVPVFAITIDEDLMEMDVEEYLKNLYDTSTGIKEALEKERYQNEIINTHKELLDTYRSVVNELNELPMEVRGQFRNIGLPALRLW